MFDIYVVKYNLYKDVAEYCGRGSPLGNPFKMKSEEDRDIVCDKYEKYFQDRINKRDMRMLKELDRLEIVGKEKGILMLGCFCAPKRCHCDTIAKYLRERNVQSSREI